MRTIQKVRSARIKMVKKNQGKKIDWRSLSREERSRKIRRIRSRKKNRGLGGRDIARIYFTGISGTGLITHCWRNGPQLRRARSYNV